MDVTGLIVVVAVLLLGVAAGLWRRHNDGRLRSDSAGSGSAGSGSAGSGSVGSGSGGAASGGAGDGGSMGGDGERIDAGLLAALGVGPADATLLQFSTAFCSPCRAVRRVSAEVAELLPGVRHVEVDAESHLEAVRALGIWRTPTLLVLDGEGRVTKRATGVPSKPQLIAALGNVLPPR
ncbi:TlpA family protein disulfide reductase [Winogradskya humida]